MSIIIILGTVIVYYILAYVSIEVSVKYSRDNVCSNYYINILVHYGILGTYI